MSHHYLPNQREFEGFEDAENDWPEGEGINNQIMEDFSTMTQEYQGNFNHAADGQLNPSQQLENNTIYYESINEGTSHYTAYPYVNPQMVPMAYDQNPAQNYQPNFMAQASHQCIQQEIPAGTEHAKLPPRAARQRQTKKDNKELIGDLEFQKLVKAIFAKIDANKAYSDLVICCQYETKRKHNVREYIKDRVAQILVHTEEKDRQKLVDMFECEDSEEAAAMGHIWAKPKENIDAVDERNKKPPMKFNALNQQWLLTEFVIVLKRGILIEPGDLARLECTSDCGNRGKVKVDGKPKNGRQCLNPFHYELKWGVLDEYIRRVVQSGNLQRLGNEFVGKVAKMSERFDTVKIDNDANAMDAVNIDNMGTSQEQFDECSDTD